MDYYQNISSTGYELISALGVPESILDRPCMEIMSYMGYEMGWSFATVNAIEHCYRAGEKTPSAVEDLKKARFYLLMELEQRYSRLAWLPPNAIAAIWNLSGNTRKMLEVITEIDNIVATAQFIENHSSKK